VVSFPTFYSDKSESEARQLMINFFQNDLKLQLTTQLVDLFLYREEAKRKKTIDLSMVDGREQIKMIEAEEQGMQSEEVTRIFYMWNHPKVLIPSPFPLVKDVLEPIEVSKNKFFPCKLLEIPKFKKRLSRAHHEREFFKASVGRLRYADPIFAEKTKGLIEDMVSPFSRYASDPSRTGES